MKDQHRGRTVLTITEDVVEILRGRHALEVNPGAVRVRPPAPPEQATMLLVGVSRAGGDLEVLVHRVLEPGDDQLRRNVCFVQLSSAVQFEAFVQAREAGGVATVHHHPGAEFFSHQDRAALKAMNRHLFRIAPGSVHVALVFGSGGVVGKVWESAECCRSLDEIRIVGPAGLGRWFPSDSPATAPFHLDRGLHDRTIRVYGEEVLEQAARLRYGIVSGGGLGSVVCDTLKYLGTRFVLVEPDRVERHNGARLSGYHHGDDGLFKTEVLRRAVLEYNPTAEVECINEPFPAEASVEALKRCDVLLCGPDADWVRYEVNRFAARYLKPAFFLGTEVKLHPDSGKVRRILGQVRFFHPGGPCCVCQGLRGVIHHPTVMEFGRRAGYIRDDASAATPSIVTVNQTVATLAVTRLLRYLAGEPAGTNLYYDETDFRIDDLSGLHPRDRDCPFCGPAGCAGLGDVEPVPLLEGGDLEDDDFSMPVPLTP